MAMGGDRDVEAAIGGDREAFARLYRRFARAVFLDLVARVRGREDAEDALQATFLAAWANLPRLRRPKRFVPWLFKIARNKARDQMRRDQPRLVLLGTNRDLIAPDPGESGEGEALRPLVAGLRPETRAVVLLRAVEGWSAREVAAAHGVSASTVRRRYARALEHLRRALAGRKEDDEEDGDRTPRSVRL